MVLGIACLLLPGEGSVNLFIYSCLLNDKFVIPCLFHVIRKISMVGCRITFGLRPHVIRHPTIDIFPYYVNKQGITNSLHHYCDVPSIWNLEFIFSERGILTNELKSFTNIFSIKFDIYIVISEEFTRARWGYENCRAKLNCGDSIVKNWDPDTQMINLRKYWIAILEEMSPCNLENWIKVDRKGTEIVHLWFLHIHILLWKGALPIAATRNQMTHFCLFRLKLACNYAYVAHKMQSFLKQRALPPYNTPRRASPWTPMNA